ncbi:MAG TPA: molybdate ABC transporter permease subunit [Polyangiales bacterium]|nr:molybdate ABC transporter permease subunit [Polyangiales bacterium]
MGPLYTPADLAALRLSFELAALTSAILLVLATPIALWLARGDSPLRALVDALVALPLVLPPTVLGFYLLCLLGRDGVIGSLFQRAGFAPPVFNFSGILIGSLIYSLPFVVQALQQGFRAVSVPLLEAASTLRASPWSTFFAVVLPLSKRAFLSGGVLAFAHTLGEFGVVLMIGGSIPGRTQTASIAIFSHVEALDYRSAHVLSATLVIIALALLSTMYALNRRAMSGAR